MIGLYIRIDSEGCFLRDIDIPFLQNEKEMYGTVSYDKFHESSFEFCNDLL
jgi:hypothetical protein